jgi:hypothetical protein
MKCNKDFIHAKYSCINKGKENNFCGEYDTNLEEGTGMRVYGWETSRKDTLGEPRIGWGVLNEGSRMYLCWEGVDWTNLAHDKTSFEHCDGHTASINFSVSEL